MSDKIYLGPNASYLDYDDKVPKITRVNLIVDSDHMYTSGGDTGRTLEVNCPWGTQEMADSILLKVGSADYQPYVADNAMLDPAAEIGDGITVGGIYSVIAIASVSFDKQCSSGIKAPYTDDIDDEYPYITPQQRAIARQISKTRSQINKTASEIRLEVSSELDNLSTSISVQLQSITTTVQGINGEINTINQTLEGVAFKSGLADGTTLISGGCIRTGYLTSQRIQLIQDMLWYPSDVPDGSTAESWFAEENAVGQLGFSNLTVDGSTTDCLIYSALKNPLVVGSNLTTYVLGQKVDIHGTLYLNGVYSPIQSDRRLKSDIDYSRSQQMAKLFDNLMPVTYRYNVEPDRIRMGFLAQDVLFAGNQAQLSNVAVDIDNRGYYVLHTDELLAAVVAKVQQIAKRLE